MVLLTAGSTAVILLMMFVEWVLEVTKIKGTKKKIIERQRKHKEGTLEKPKCEAICLLFLFLFFKLPSLYYFSHWIFFCAITFLSILWSLCRVFGGSRNTREEYQKCLCKLILFERAVALNEFYFLFEKFFVLTLTNIIYFFLVQDDLNFSWLFFVLYIFFSFIHDNRMISVWLVAELKKD